MKLVIPIVDLVDGDVVIARQDDNGFIHRWPEPLTVSVVKVSQTILEYRVIADGKPGLLHLTGYPPGVYLHVLRDEFVPGASHKP